MESKNGNGKLGTSGYVALTDGSIDTAGAVVWWRLAGGLDLEKLKAAWTAAELPERWLPEAPSPEVALRRAVGELRGSRQLVRPLEGTKGWAVIKESATGDDLDYSKALVVAKLNKVGKATIGAGPGGLDPQGDSLPDIVRMIGEVTAAFTRCENEYPSGAVSGWLCDIVSLLGAVSLRDTGGVYFVPRDSLDQWNKVAEALRVTSAHVVLGMPALRTSDAVDAILDALTQEMNTETTRLDDDVAGGKLGKRALNTRLMQINSLGAKLGRYETLLGARLDDIRTKLSQCEVAVTGAILAIDPNDDLAGSLEGTV
jgi:hypothetical protein